MLVNKYALILIIAFICTNCIGQTKTFESLLYRAKEEFNKEDFDEQDYSKAAGYLEKAIKIKPNDAEARYFLGYAYSRINSKDGGSMIDMNKELTVKSSEQFEYINKIAPKYEGKIVLLDPYSKISSEWGSLAMSYWHNSKIDSAKWALNEGKKRGGFNKYILEINRKVLESCEPNSILISSGDNFTISLWYLQIMENYRKDVAVIDVSLLNATWYPNYLSDKKIVSFDLPQAVLDTISYCEWQNTMVTIDDFSWTLKPSYYDKYLLRGDRIFLSLLKQNNFQRPVYFTTSFTESMRLSLGDYLSNFIVIDKLSPKKENNQSFDDYKKSMIRVLELSKFINTNSRDELNLQDSFYFNIFGKIDDYLTGGKTEKAKELMSILNRYVDGQKFLPKSDNYKRYEGYLKQRIYGI